MSHRIILLLLPLLLAGCGPAQVHCVAALYDSENGLIPMERGPQGEKCLDFHDEKMTCAVWVPCENAPTDHEPVYNEHEPISYLTVPSS